MNHINEIRKGVALLNERGPENWLNRIDLGELDLRRTDLCVIGQLYNGFNDGLIELDIDPYDHDAINGHGFDTSTVATTSAYDALTEQWREEIARLRAESQPVAV